MVDRRQLSSWISRIRSSAPTARSNTHGLYRLAVDAYLGWQCGGTHPHRLLQDRRRLHQRLGEALGPRLTDQPRVRRGQPHARRTRGTPGQLGLLRVGVSELLLLVRLPAGNGNAPAQQVLGRTEVEPSLRLLPDSPQPTTHNPLPDASPSPVFRLPSPVLNLLPARTGCGAVR